jgi:hypothetical protein
MADFPASTIKITGIEPHGADKVLLTVEVLVDVHRMVEIGGKMLSVAARGAAKKKR